MAKFTIPTKKKLDKDENFIKFEIPADSIQSICGQEKVKRAIENGGVRKGEPTNTTAPAKPQSRLAGFVRG